MSMYISACRKNRAFIANIFELCKEYILLAIQKCILVKSAHALKRVGTNEKQRARENVDIKRPAK